MKKIIKRILFRILNIRIVEESYLLNLMINFISRVRFFRTPLKIKKRSRLSIFEYKKLSERLNYYPFFHIAENNLYGNAKCLCDAGKISNRSIKKVRIEHGLIFGSLVQEHTMLSYAKTICTYSNYRKQFIQQKVIGKSIIAVGPYIKYADFLMEEHKRQELKKTLGKTLLVFPAHSIDTAYSHFDINILLNYIMSKKDQYNTILVCLYWKDILLGRHEEYEKIGCRVVTAGHLYDYNFIRRLKDIISLSDKTMSNVVGTHVGYSICLEKPHFILDTLVHNKLTEHKDSIKDVYARKGDDFATYNVAIDDIKKCFTKDIDFITEEQRSCVRSYWGDF